MHPYDVINPLDPFGGLPGDSMDQVLSLQSYGVANTMDCPVCTNSGASCVSDQSCLSWQSQAPPPPPPSGGGEEEIYCY